MRGCAALALVLAAACGTKPPPKGPLHVRAPVRAGIMLGLDAIAWILAGAGDSGLLDRSIPLAEHSSGHTGVAVTGFVMLAIDGALLHCLDEDCDAELAASLSLRVGLPVIAAGIAEWRGASRERVAETAWATLAIGQLVEAIGTAVVGDRPPD